MTNTGGRINPRARPGDPHLSARTPPGRVYHDPEILRTEMEKMFYRSWLNIAHESALPNPGDFLVRNLGQESLVFIRGDDGKIRGFYNVCRHRGTRIVTEPCGEKMRSIVCPYHAWTYGTDGRLVGAPHTDGLVDFRKEDFGLHPVRTETRANFVWATLDEKAPSLNQELGGFFQKVARWDLSRLRRAAVRTYEVEANWKILIENYQECYHCAPIHPGLNRLTPYLEGENDGWMAHGSERSAFSGGWMPFAKDYTSMTVTGYTNRPILKGFTEEDRRRIYYWVVFPNLFFSLHPDYLMIHRDWPATPSHSRIECEWYFDVDTMAREDFDPSDAVDMWDEINRQDWAVCSQTQLGVVSKAWKGGRFSEQEPLVHDFDKYYLEKLDGAARVTSRKRRARGT